MSGETKITLGGGTPSITLTRGAGSWVWDDRGNSYLDCTSQGWALYLGHAAPEIRAHADQVMAELWHTHQGFPTPQRELFAERLLGLVHAPPGAHTYDRVAVTATGGLAVETALKLSVLNRPGRTKFARLRGSFHGTTLGVAQASWPAHDDVDADRRSLAAYAQLGPRFESLTFPERPRTTWASAGYHAADDEAEQLRTLDVELDRIGSDLRAVVVEPIQGSGGQRAVPKVWLERLRDRARSDGFLVIYDEIQTYIRAGRFFTEIESLQPDLVVLGKGLGGGFACGAVLLRADLAGFPATGVHDLHTFSSSALAHSVAVKIIDIVERDGLLDAARSRGAQLAAGLVRLQAGYPELADIRQVGLHVGVELAGADADRTPRPDLAAAVREAARDRGLLLGVGGYKPAVIKIKPPLTTSPAEVDQILTRLAEALKATL